MTTTGDSNIYKVLNLTRTFDAPIDLVWEVWTNPKHFSEWYAPDNFTIPVCKLDVRPGGSIRIDMQGPDGTVYPSIGTFEEVKKPLLLAFLQSPIDAKGDKLFEILHTVSLTKQGNGTLMNLSSKVVSAGPNAAPYLAGMEAGLNQALSKLSNIIELVKE